ncbi:hypothetical protein HDF24_01200 [Mucilaginibacter sp. X4EP1]|uniref:hypothetical protein n=1 Tax=Mucilaginibacter sp. X4EP1 TaxID=2723092 RepID=UPI0021670F82|nr:hypothetical protein [Mucilaginibacter sp. X4EP1]MCS3811632.1 hypothetical protein [Mucilaginibacter sp. X4EP1]
MKKIIILLACCWAYTCQAQTTDTTSRLAASYFEEVKTASQNQHIWNETLYGPMLLVQPRSRVVYANAPDSAGILKPDGAIYKGVLPKTLIIANTSIIWEGKMWSVVMWPLPANHDERLNLMVHESFHRIQNKLALNQRSPTADHLSSMYGRIYFLLEMQALKVALSKPVDQRGEDLTDALLFREKRHELFPSTFANERILEMNEGLAEYTGVIIGRQKDSIRQYLFHIIDTLGNRKSFIRASAYISGPMYGYLLYEKSPGWTLKVDSNSDFPTLISQYYHISLPKDTTGIAALQKQYNGDAIIASEMVKEKKRLEMYNQYIDLFTKKPVLTITLIKMNIGFNPSILFDLGDYGTVYPIAEVRDKWGQVTISAPGVLMKNWQVITLSASEGIKQTGQLIEGNGWKLQLNENWQLTKTDALHYQLVNKN